MRKKKVMPTKVSTTISYHGKAFTINNKDAGPINLYLENNPSVEELKQYMVDNYRDVIESVAEKNPKPNEPPQSEVKLDYKPVEFVQKQVPEFPKFPALPQLNFGPIAKELFLESVVALNGTDVELSDHFAKRVLDRARRVLEILDKTERAQKDMDRLKTVKEETDKFEKYSKEFSNDSSHRQKQQRIVQDLIRVLVNEYNL